MGDRGEPGTDRRVFVLEVAPGRLSKWELAGLEITDGLVLRLEMTSGEAGGRSPCEEARRRSYLEVGMRAAGGSLRLEEVCWRACREEDGIAGAVEASILGPPKGVTRLTIM